MRIDPQIIIMLIFPETYFCPEIVTRAEWGAREPFEDPVPLGDNVRLLIVFKKGVVYFTVCIQFQLHYLFTHHSAGRSCFNREDCAAEARAIQDLHMDINGTYIILLQVNSCHKLFK